MTSGSRDGQPQAARGARREWWASESNRHRRPLWRRHGPELPPGPHDHGHVKRLNGRASDLEPPPLRGLRRLRRDRGGASLRPSQGRCRNLGRVFNRHLHRLQRPKRRGIGGDLHDPFELKDRIEERMSRIWKLDTALNLAQDRRENRLGGGALRGFCPRLFSCNIEAPRSNRRRALKNSVPILDEFSR